MKTLCTLFLIGVGFSAVAQRSSVSKHITTDGHQLWIRVDIEEPSRSVHYSRSFDVSDLERVAVKALENRIIDSLEQHTSALNTVVIGAQKHETSIWKKQADDRSASWSDKDENADSRLEANAASSLSPADVMPSAVVVREDKENGRLWMQYTFQKDGDELVIERTANVVGKSEREKQAIIRETERSFGIKTGNQ